MRITPTPSQAKQQVSTVSTTVSTTMTKSNLHAENGHFNRTRNRTSTSIVKPLVLSGVLAFSSMGLTGCGYNQLQAQDEQANAAWSEVESQYKRRADLVPNLVAVVGQYADHEQEVFTEVAAARARAGSVQLTPETLNDPEALANYQAAQSEMTGALSRLLAVSENYPELKADKRFAELQSELSGTENRIAVARNRYIEDVQTYNTSVRQFPKNITAKVFGLDPRVNFTVENAEEIANAPQVNFGD